MSSLFLLYNDNEPLSPVANSGDYNDLANKPTLGTAAALDVGTTALKVVQLTNDAKLPAVDGSLLTGIGSTASDITVDTTNFNLNLSGTDTTVQLALETLDDLIAGAGGHTIQDEGTPLTARTNLNFIGTAVTATDNSGADSTDVTINLPSTGSGLNLGTWDNAGTFTTGVRFDGASDKVILPQATTAQRTAITPLASELIYDTNLNQFFYGDGTTSGGKAVGSTTVADNVFRIQDNSDATKQIAFEASGITTATTRTLTSPDASGTIALIDTTGISDKDLFYYDSSSKLFKRIAIGTTDQALIAKPSLDPPYQFGTVASSGRELLTSNRTYYVRTDGSDSNNGLTNTSGGAFLTIQKAVDVACSLDMSIYDISILVGTGTFTTPVVLKTFLGSGTITIRGINNDSTSTIISTTSADAFSGEFVGIYKIQYLKIVTTTSGHGIFGIGKIKFGNIDFGTCSGSHLVIDTGSSYYECVGNYNISGSASSGGSSHIACLRGGYIIITGKTITLTSTPAFREFCWSAYCATALVYSNSYSGSATGVRYSATLNGVIYSGGNTFPGNSAGSTATGGQYS